jgi:hypothetical protein
MLGALQMEQRFEKTMNAASEILNWRILPPGLLVEGTSLQEKVWFGIAEKRMISKGNI